MKPLFFVAALCAFCAQVPADTIQDSFGAFSVNFLSGASVTGALPGFNPSLGTLDGIAFSYTSSAVLLEGDANSSNIKIYDSVGTLLTQIVFPMMVGRAEQTKTGNFSVPANDLADFESTGNIDLTLSPSTACRGRADTPSGCQTFTGSIDGQVTYTYTPATPASPSAAPEPQSLWLLAAGLGALIFAKRKRAFIRNTRAPAP